MRIIFLLVALAMASPVWAQTQRFPGAVQVNAPTLTTTGGAVRSDDGVPGAGLGSKGDFYMRRDTPYGLYFRDDTGWHLVGGVGPGTLNCLSKFTSVSNVGDSLACEAAGLINVTGGVTVTTKVRTPLIDTASGGLTLTPAGNNVTITTGKALTTAYSPGWTGAGYTLDHNVTVPSLAFMELDNLSVRGTMNVYELLIQQIRATNGSIFVSSTGTVKSVTGSGPYVVICEDDASELPGYCGFAVGDLIRAQRFTGNGVYQSNLQVTAIGAGGTDFTATLASGTAPAAGMDFVRLGNTGATANRQGSIYLTADDTGAPHINVIDLVDSFAAWGTAEKIRVRIGRLDGSYGFAGGGHVYGFASGSDTGTNITITAATGISINYGTTQKFYADTAGNLTLAGSLAVGTTGHVRGGQTAFNDGTGFFIGYEGGFYKSSIGIEAGNRVTFDGLDVLVKSDTVNIDAEGIGITLGAAETYGSDRAYHFRGSYGGESALWAYEAGNARFMSLTNRVDGSGGSNGANLFFTASVQGGGSATIQLNAGPATGTIASTGAWGHTGLLTGTTLKSVEGMATSNGTPRDHGIHIPTGTPTPTTATLYSPNGSDLYYHGNLLATMGVGGSISGGPLTTNRIPRGTAAQVIGDGSITDTGTAVSTASTVSISGTTAVTGTFNAAVNGTTTFIDFDGLTDGAAETVSMVAVRADGRLFFKAAGVGTVTSVAFTAPAAIFNVAGSPIISNGSIDLTLDAQTATHFLAGPTPSFRAIADADVPDNITVTLVGDVTGTTAASVVGDDTHNHGSATITSVLESVIIDSTLLARNAAAETIAGAWLFTASQRIHAAANQLYLTTDVNVGSTNRTELWFGSDYDGTVNWAGVGQNNDGGLKLTGNGALSTPGLTLDDANAATFSSTVAATVFSGSGASLTALPAGQLTGTITAATQDLITRTGTLVAGATGAGFTIALSTSTVTGTLADARLEATIDVATALNSPLVNAATKGTFGTGTPSGSAPSGNSFLAIKEDATDATTLTGVFVGEKSAASTGSVQGVEGYTYTSNAAGTVSLSLATIGNLEHAGAGTLTSGTAVSGNVFAAAGTITSATGVSGLVQLFGTSGNITTAMGGYFNILDSGTGAIGTGYNLYLGTNDAATDWGVYQTDTGAENYFAAEVLIGSNTDAGAFALQVTGTATITSALAVGKGSAPTGTLEVYGSVAASSGVFAQVTNASSGYARQYFSRASSYSGSCGSDDTGAFGCAAGGGTTNHLSIDASGNVAMTANLNVTGYVGHPSFASQTSNWRITGAGAGDLRYLYADELRIKLMSVEEQAVYRASLMVTPSHSEVSQTFTCPAAAGTSTLWVRDAATLANAKIFPPTWVTIRAFTRTDSDADGFHEVALGDCVGEVSSYVDGSGANEGQQSWTFTRGSAPNAGQMSTSTEVPVGNAVLGWAASGNGAVELSAFDGAEGINAPYMQTKIWTTSPVAANFIITSRVGKTTGITGTAGQFGLFGGLTNAGGLIPASNGQYILATNSGVELHGIDLTLWDGATVVFRMARNGAAPYFSMGNPAPTTFASGTGCWQGDDGGTYKWRCGNPAANYIEWNGTTLYMTGGITAQSGLIGNWTINPTYIAYDTTSNPTSSGLSPSDFPFYAGATYANRANASFRVAMPDGGLFASGATISGAITASSLSITGPASITDVLTVSAAGAIRVGDPTANCAAGTGIRFDTSSLCGVAAGVTQFKLDAATGKATAGAGSVVLDSTGVLVTASGAGIGTTNSYRIGFGDTYAYWSGYFSGSNSQSTIALDVPSGESGLFKTRLSYNSDSYGAQWQYTIDSTTTIASLSVTHSSGSQAGIEVGADNVSADRGYISFTADKNIAVDTPLFTFNATLVGIGTPAPVNVLDVEGAVAIGATYSGTNTAPTNGILVQGESWLGATADLGAYILQATGNAIVTGSITARDTAFNANNAGTVVSGFVDGYKLAGWDAVGYESTGSTRVALCGYRASQWTECSMYTGGTMRLFVSSAGVRAGVNAAQYTAGGFSGRGIANVFEWGHTNTAGYGSTIGYNVSSGAPYIAFNAAAGTNANTWLTSGIAGTVIRGDLAGGLQVLTLTASADNQAGTSIVSLLATGVMTVGASTSSRLNVIGAVGFPAASGSTQTNVMRVQGSGSNSVLDFAVNGASGSALQATHAGDLSIGYPLLLNPNGGDIGIGIAPVAALHIYRAASPSIYLTDATSGATTGDGLQIQQAGVATFIWNYEAGAMQFATSGAARVTIASGGGVRFHTFADGTASFTGGIGTVTTSSDEQMKFIGPAFRTGLDAIRKLTPVRYTWNPDSGVETDGTNRWYVGFGAQSVQRYLPEAVSVGPDGRLSLNDRVITSALVNSVQEQQAQIDGLMRELAALKALVQQLLGRQP